jgi:hypothetical protein
MIWSVYFANCLLELRSKVYEQHEQHTCVIMSYIMRISFHLFPCHIFSHLNLLVLLLWKSYQICVREKINFQILLWSISWCIICFSSHEYKIIWCSSKKTSHFRRHGFPHCFLITEPRRLLDRWLHVTGPRCWQAGSILCVLINATIFDSWVVWVLLLCCLYYISIRYSFLEARSS